MIGIISKFELDIQPIVIQIMHDFHIVARYTAKNTSIVAALDKALHLPMLGKTKNVIQRACCKKYKELVARKFI